MIIHPLAWIGWLLAVLLAMTSTRNPLHLLLMLLCLALVETTTRSLTLRRNPPLVTWRLIVALPLFSALLNALSVRAGDTVLFRLPAWLPLLGGPVTLEALVFGFLNGLTLVGMFVAFLVVQRALPISALISLIPRVFYPLAVVAAIAITFVPTTLRQARQIRDAQAIRGHQIKGLRDWLPLLMPLLIGGLERALQLAEAIASRGFASAGQMPRATLMRALVVAGLTLLLAGWLLLLVWGYTATGRYLMLLGALLLLGALWYVGRHSPRTRYRNTPWRQSDVAVLIAALVVVGAICLPLPGIDRTVLAYYPYPRLSLPAFDPVLGFASLGLAWPALVLFVLPPVEPSLEKRDADHLV